MAEYNVLDLSLLSQPWTVQLGLGAGYASYTLAYAGIRQHHTITDIFFKSILYSLFTTFVLLAFGDREPQWVVISFAVALPIMSALVWRLWVYPAYSQALQKFGYTADESPSAWHSLSHDEKHFFTQVAILTDDDEWLRCDDLSAFQDSPSGAAVFGANGDVALYLTHRQKVDEDEKELKSTRSEGHGDRMAYIPANRIKRVNFRRLRV